MRRAATLLLLVWGAQGISAALNIEAFGAVANDSSIHQAAINGLAINAAFAAAQYNGTSANGTRTVLVPASKTFWVLPAGDISGLTDITFQVDGTLSALTTNLSAWPNNTDGSAKHLVSFSFCSDVTITGSGSIVGNGYDWWWYVILTGHDNRPNLLQLFSCENVLLESVYMANSPMYHVFASDMLNFTARNMEIYVDVEAQAELLSRKGFMTVEGDGSGMPAGIPTFPLNTDGIDPAGRNVWISNVTITNFDDAIAVKPTHEGGRLANCSENMLIEDIHVRFGVGMTIGSVPPHALVNCVRNITFRNVDFTTPIKAIYVKTNPGHTGSGIIDGITYENIYAKSPLWWSIYIAQQQQDQPGGVDTNCSFFYPLGNSSSSTCAANPLITISNIVLRNITMEDAVLSAGLILCNATNPCNGFVMDAVNISSLTNWPVSAGYMCTSAAITTSNSFPVPACVLADDE